MYLDDIPIHYWGVLVAAIVYFVIGAIWYSPFLFGHSIQKEDIENAGEMKKCKFRCIGTYVVEFIIGLILAYVLALFIQLSQAEEIVEGVIVSIWAWFGFMVTTHLSAVMWGHKLLKAFFVHMGFLLVSLIAMGAVIMSMNV